MKSFKHWQKNRNSIFDKDWQPTFQIQNQHSPIALMLQLFELLNLFSKTGLKRVAAAGRWIAGKA